MQAFNFTTMKPYTGQNAGLVSNGELNAFATFSQIQSGGFLVKKGAKGIKIFCGYHITAKAKDATNDDGTKFNSPRYSVVFDIADTTAADDKDFIAWVREEFTRLQTA
jgi:hypothetical protein